MKVRIKRAATLLSAVVLTLLTGTASATNGYFTHGVGTESKGMGGSGIGSDGVSGPIMGASNPAVSVFASDSWETRSQASEASPVTDTLSAAPPAVTTART